MKKKRIYFVIIFLLFIVVSITLVLHYNKNNNIEKINNSQEEVFILKDAKYTPEEMLSFFKGESSPDDMDAYYDIILNWYDYYSKDTLFINRKGDVYSYEEYMKIKKYRSEYFIKTSLPIISKDFLIVTLEKEI